MLISRLLLCFLFLLLPYNALATTTTPERFFCSFYTHLRVFGIIRPFTFIPDYRCARDDTHCIRIDCERDNNVTHVYRNCFRMGDFFEAIKREDGEKYCGSKEHVVVVSSVKLCKSYRNVTIRKTKKTCNHPDNDDYVSTASTADVSTADTTTTTADLTATTTKPKLICSLHTPDIIIENNTCYAMATHCVRFGCERDNNASFFVHRTCAELTSAHIPSASGRENTDRFCGKKYDWLVISSLKFCQGTIDGLPCNHPDNDGKVKTKCARMDWEDKDWDKTDVEYCEHGCIKVMCYSSSEPYATRYGIWRGCYHNQAQTRDLTKYCRKKFKYNETAFYPETEGVYHCNKDMCNEVNETEERIRTTKKPFVWTTTTVTSTTTTVTKDMLVATDSRGNTAINGWVKGTSQPFKLEKIGEACGSPAEKDHLSPEFSMKICVRNGYNCSQGLLLCYVSRLSNDHSWDSSLRGKLNLEDRTDQFAPAMVDIVHGGLEWQCKQMVPGWQGARLNALNLVAINNTLEIQTSISQSGNERKVVKLKMGNTIEQNSRCSVIRFGLKDSDMDEVLDEIINGLPLADLNPLDILRFDVTMGLPLAEPVFVVTQRAHDHFQAWQCQMRITFEEGDCKGNCEHESNNPAWKVVQPKIDKGNQTKEQVKE